MSGKEVHKRYTIEFKLAVVDWIKHHKSSYRAAAKQFGIDRKMAREWSANKALYEAAMTKHGTQRCRVQGGRPPLSSDLDKVVLEFLKSERSKGNRVPDRDLQASAVEASRLLGIASFKGTPQWLRRWKKRQGVVTRDGGNVHDPTSPSKSGVDHSPKSKGDSLLSHIEPKEQVKLDKKLAKKNAQNSPKSHLSLSFSPAKEKPCDSSLEGANQYSFASTLAGESALGRNQSQSSSFSSSSEDEEKSVVLDFSAPEHSYCQSDCLVEEEMISQIPLLGDLEGNDILQLITAEGVVERIGGLRYEEEDDNAGSRCHHAHYAGHLELCLTGKMTVVDDESLSLGQEVIVSETGSEEIASIVASFRSSRGQETHQEFIDVEDDGSEAIGSKILHSCPHPRSLLGEHCDHSARTLGAGSIQRYPNQLQGFTIGMQSFPGSDHDYEFSSLGRLSPQLPSLPLLPSLPPAFGHHSGLLQDFGDFPPSLVDPMNMINSAGLFGGLDRNLYSKGRGTAAPIVYVDRPSSPPCAHSPGYR